MLNIVEKAFFLKKTALFSGLDEQDLLRVADIAEDITYKPGEYLFRQGDPGDALYIVLDGRVSVLVDGTEVNILENGQCLGEVAVLATFPRTAGAVAATDLYVLRVARSAFQDLFIRNRSLRLDIIRELGGRLFEISRRVWKLERATKT